MWFLEKLHPTSYTYILEFPYHIKQSTTKIKEMEVLPIHPSSFGTSPLLFTNHFIPHNYVHCTEILDSHIYSADLSGVKEEELRVEIEDTKYLIIRTEAIDGFEEPAKSFMRKIKLPEGMDIENISVGYEDGVLTITVPRSLEIELSKICHVAAKAA